MVGGDLSTNAKLVHFDVQINSQDTVSRRQVDDSGWARQAGSEHPMATAGRSRSNHSTAITSAPTARAIAARSCPSWTAMAIGWRHATGGCAASSVRSSQETSSPLHAARRSAAFPGRCNSRRPGPPVRILGAICVLLRIQPTAGGVCIGARRSLGTK